MANTGKWLLYGANGYTGELTARVASERSLQPILAGRNADAVERVAERYGMDYRIFGLDTASTIDACLEDVEVVLNCAGPFSRTARPMVEACLRSGTHYLDVTGEIGVFEAIARKDAEAKTAGVMLMPGAGFDVVPSDCLAAHLAGRIDRPQKLVLAFRGIGGGMSHGTATTMIENLDQGSAVRRDGQLVKVKPGSLTRDVDYGRGPSRSMAIPWGDLSTAWVSTGIPNIEVYVPAPMGLLTGARIAGFAPWLVGSKPVKKLMKWRIDRGPAGPSDEERARSSSVLWGRVENSAGEAAEARLTTPNGYTLTALASLHIVERVLAGDAPVGFQTPSMAYGADLILQIEGTSREDLLAA